TRLVTLAQRTTACPDGGGRRFRLPQGGPDGNFRPLRPRHPVSMLASVVCYAGLLAMLAGALSLIRPLRFLRIRSRRAGAVLAVVAVAVSVVALLLPVRLVRAQLHAGTPSGELDEL